MRALWFISGVLSLTIGFIGIILPLVPTVPLVLLAAFCFARSSETLHSWLLNHKTFGIYIAEWQERGAIPVRGKQLATVSIAAVLCISLIARLPIHVLIIQGITLSLVMLFIWSRPNA